MSGGREQKNVWPVHNFLTLEVTHAASWAGKSVATEGPWRSGEGSREGWRGTLAFEEKPCSPLMPGWGAVGRETSRPSAPTPCLSTESPSVSVTGHAAPGHKRTLKCLAYDFYPRSIGLHWTRAGDAKEAESGGDVLPSGNGTYQSWVVVEVPSEDQAPYSCHVEHRSLAQPLPVLWDPRQQAK